MRKNVQETDRHHVIVDICFLEAGYTQVRQERAPA